MLPLWLSDGLTAYDDPHLSEQIQARFAETDLEALRFLGLIVLRPDSLARGTGSAIVAALSDEYGIVPLALRVLQISQALANSLYRSKMASLGTRAWLQQKTLCSGPAAVMIVAGQPDGHGSLSERLDAIKGGSCPVDRDDVGLRSRFGRASSVHAVIHCSEDPAALIYESSLVFSWSSLVAMTRAVDLSSNTIEDVALPDDLRDALLTCGVPASSSVFQVVLQTMTRIVAALRLKPTFRDGVMAQLWDLVAESSRELQPLDYRAQRDAFLRFAAEEQNLLCAAIRQAAAHLHNDVSGELAAADPSEFPWECLDDCHDRLQMLRVMGYLSGHHTFTGTDIDSVFSLLARSNVPLTPAEKGMLEAAIFCDVNQHVKWDGRLLFPATPRDDGEGGA